jgi:hypothetical protein
MGMREDDAGDREDEPDCGKLTLRFKQGPEHMTVATRGSFGGVNGTTREGSIIRL